MTILDRWQLTATELTAIIDDNPSLRGFLLGYIAEYKLRTYLTNHPAVTDLYKPDDHSRDASAKADMIVAYRGHRFAVEVKSLQTNSIRHADAGIFTGKAQVDASDNRDVTLPNGETVKTTCLLVGEFDMLAINLFQFQEQWDFAFILNRDLPRSTYRRYTEQQREYLLATLVGVSWPLEPPFASDPFVLLDKLVQERGGPSA